LRRRKLAPIKHCFDVWHIGKLLHLPVFVFNPSPPPPPPTSTHRVKKCMLLSEQPMFSLNSSVADCDILVRIVFRIRGSVPLTNGSNSVSGSYYFRK
jgi:hypothetical protein